MPYMRITRILEVEGEPSVNNAALGAVECETIRKTEIDLAAVEDDNIGELTSRTDADTGTVTLLTDHDIETADVVDIYWSGGMRYGMTATVTALAVALDGGGGDNLPVLNTTGIVVVVQSVKDSVYFDGDDLEQIYAYYQNDLDPDAKAHIDFQDSGNVTIHEVDFVEKRQAAGLDEATNINGGDTNNYTGNAVTHVHVSHNSQTGAGKLWIYAGINST